MKPMRWIFLALIFHCGGVSPVLADPFEDSAWAYEAGDYRAAVMTWLPAAARVWESGAVSWDGRWHDD